MLILDTRFTDIVSIYLQYIGKKFEDTKMAVNQMQKPNEKGQQDKQRSTKQHTHTQTTTTK